ncbi:N-acetylglucosamine-6-phosphate deacetylase [Alicyclobacillus shizuokensis]|uniref:N-acetylglucosamine-6-phosphate deacetylase n=1 Tax=Alicyclobacillus shizuokensis TaxID=392014 RepID=UPI0008303DB5|nr:N-acetylglucosamine-6-phosphate deacetylase [Alicyclobacillus shizuokensis]MCL6626602.1 N-acetylglucosamine-6-phosphate deacetylase [Alicyclobacillus shizuokensis]
MGSDDWVLNGVRIVTSTGICEDGYVRVQNGVIRELGAGPAPAAAPSTFSEPRGAWLVPGFIDMHVHGGDGADVMDGRPESVERIGRFHASHGTTGWLPTTLTASADRLLQALDAVHEVRQRRWQGPVILGVHLEGPFIAPSRRGAQNPEHIVNPSVSLAESLLARVPGLVRSMTLAPERPGARDLIEWLGRQGVLVSMGHTDCDSDTAGEAIRQGVRQATHLFNGMRGLHHRQGGPVAQALLDERVVCELIADGQHVDWDVLRLVVKVKGADGVTLITDAMAAAGRPDGEYDLGGLPVSVRDGRACLAGSDQLAGSTLTMDQAVRNMAMKVGVGLFDAVRMASTTPARQLGLSHCKGDIRPGMDADLVLLDESLSVLATWVGGERIFHR